MGTIMAVSRRRTLATGFGIVTAIGALALLLAEERVPTRGLALETGDSNVRAPDSPPLLVGHHADGGNLIRLDMPKVSPSDLRRRLDIGSISIRIEGLPTRHTVEPVRPFRLIWDPEGIDFTCVLTRRVLQGDPELPVVDVVVRVVDPATERSVQAGVIVDRGVDLGPRQSWDAAKTADQAFRSGHRFVFREELTFAEEASLRVSVDGTEVLRRRAILEPAAERLTLTSDQSVTKRFRLHINRMRATNMRAAVVDRSGRTLAVDLYDVRVGDDAIDPTRLPETIIEDADVSFAVDCPPGAGPLSAVLVELDGQMGRSYAIRLELPNGDR